MRINRANGCKTLSTVPGAQELLCKNQLLFLFDLILYDSKWEKQTTFIFPICTPLSITHQGLHLTLGPRWVDWGDAALHIFGSSPGSEYYRREFVCNILIRGTSAIQKETEGGPCSPPDSESLKAGAEIPTAINQIWRINCYSRSRSCGEVGAGF